MSRIVHVTGQGTLEGSLDSTKRVAKFLNVPFGMVLERWRPAVKPAPWSGTRDAAEQGPVPPQPRGESRYSRRINQYSGFDFDDKTAVFDENCLNLNIYVHENTLNAVPQDTVSQGAAVMIYFYGGAYRDGANAMDLFDGTNLVCHSATIGRPVIVVVPNFRLNFLGFFSCPELVADLASDPKLKSDYERSAGNWGLQDQRLALEWVRDHIAAFGGQPGNVTVFGESVGAVSINYHMLIPQHRGLFQRAIMQSCAMNSAPAVRPDVEGRLYLDYLVDYFNIPKDLSGKEKLERLKSVPAVELGLASDSKKLRMFTPYVDGTMVPEDVRLWTHRTELYDTGVKAVMVGETKDEGTMFVGSLGSFTVEGWARVKEKYCPPDQQSQKEWEALYGKIERDADAARASDKVVEHSLFAYPEFSALRALSKRKDLSRGTDGAGLSLFQYYFDRSIDAVDAKTEGWGAHHGIDMVYVFAPDYAIKSVLTDEEKKFADKVQTMWIRFAYGETTAQESFLAKITRPVDDYTYHHDGAAKEAIVYTERLTIEQERVGRHGKEVFEFWEKSEKWTHDVREAKRHSEEGLRVGLLCIAQPSASEWS
ncbi:hypothetical protein BGX28_002259 [Mortierella sp. GBA30]|nr:hypothetical protein BGX28_002259 [Mortierella sp. GBA30]